MTLPRALAFVGLAAAPACSLLVESDDLVAGRSSTPDAAPDAFVAAEAGACTTRMLCDGFEGDGNATWEPELTGNATIAVDTKQPRSGTRSLHATRAAAAGRANADWRTPLRGRPLSCDFDAYATATGKTSLSVLKLSFDGTPAPYQGYQVSISLGGGAIEEYASKGPSTPALYSTVLVGALGFGRWIHLRADFTWTAPASIRLSVDGAPPVSLALSPPASTAQSLALGMVYQGEVDVGWDVFVDNVACTLE